MKIKLSIIALLAGFLFLFPVPQQAQAVEYKIANQMTLEWAVTAPNNAGEQIEYIIYIVPSDDKSSPTKLWQGPETEYTVTMSATDDGLFLFGLQTVRLVDVDGTMEAVSTAEIGWSDDPAVAPTPFGLRFYQPPASGGGFGQK